MLAEHAPVADKSGLCVPHTGMPLRHAHVAGCPGPAAWRAAQTRLAWLDSKQQYLEYMDTPTGHCTCGLSSWSALGFLCIATPLSGQWLAERLWPRPHRPGRGASSQALSSREKP